VLDSVLLALAASLCWGTTDFTAGLKARSLPLPTVLMITQGVGLTIAAVVVAISADPFPAAAEALSSLGAGAAVVAGLGCFYRALSSGTMSVVAPVAATGVAIPVAVGLLDGNRLAGVQVVGMLAAVAGVVFAARHPERSASAAGRRRHRESIGLAVVAAVAFGGYYLLAHVGARGGVPWLLALAGVAGVSGVGLMALLTRTRPRVPPAGDLGLLALAGALECAATGLYGIANRHGQLSIVAVAGSLYPVATVLLARIVLRERLFAWQATGVALALAGVALIAA
jgi:drug/metabolite transporter (DMT)-like permease